MHAASLKVISEIRSCRPTPRASCGCRSASWIAVKTAACLERVSPPSRTTSPVRMEPLLSMMSTVCVPRALKRNVGAVGSSVDDGGALWRLRLLPTLTAESGAGSSSGGGGGGSDDSDDGVATVAGTSPAAPA